MRRALAIAAAIVFLALGSIAQAADEEGFKSMFNGKDLTGWEGKPGGWWVEDGAITSESTKENPCVKHHYLYWQGGEPADFVLRLKYKLVGGNSGIQFRSQRRPNFDTWGYQADMEAGPQWTGCLFQHTRGGTGLQTSLLAFPGQPRPVTRGRLSCERRQRHSQDRGKNQRAVAWVFRFHLVVLSLDL